VITQLKVISIKANDTVFITLEGKGNFLFLFVEEETLLLYLKFIPKKEPISIPLRHILFPTPVGALSNMEVRVSRPCYALGFGKKFII